ncbi:MAG: DUF2059 domain-containing protein [Alphaproteobacteria bacterium]|nr:DUF2059 domain-containing protein [Alphaproteobacteria bacterium]
MRLTRFALSLLAAPLLAALCGTAIAQTAPAAPPIPPPVPAASAAAHAEAAALTEMIGASKQTQQLISILRNQMIQLVMRAGAKPPAGDPTKPAELLKAEDATKIVDEILMPDFVAQQADLNTQIIDVWAANFTVEDLKALRSFYATPLGQKLIATLPAVTQQGMSAGQAWGQRIYQASINKNKDALIARGLRF